MKSRYFTLSYFSTILLKVDIFKFRHLYQKNLKAPKFHLIIFNSFLSYSILCLNFLFTADKNARLICSDPRSIWVEKKYSILFENGVSNTLDFAVWLKPINLYKQTKFRLIVLFICQHSDHLLHTYVATYYSILIKSKKFFS